MSNDKRADAQAITDRQIAGIIKSLQKIDAPQFYASNVQVMRAGNDFLMVLLRPRASTGADGNLSPYALSEVQAVISFSPGTLKDMQLMLHAGIETYEQDFGPIVTIITRAMAARPAVTAPVSTEQQ